MKLITIWIEVNFILYFEFIHFRITRTISSLETGERNHGVSKLLRKIEGCSVTNLENTFQRQENTIS